ncbi:hypothetical protein [Gilvimarinus polysaccharolyticus]|uniref:hypothetical protein n=1 Tax=Gilvimarinus polysaccharolyticus TaxID=863921 RepID=UPI00067357DC|nr:hypothetical protein [Gilvimarinus polysaccharolyticus]
MPVDMDIRHCQPPEDVFAFLPNPTLEALREPATKPAGLRFLTAALITSALTHLALIYFLPAHKPQGFVKADLTSEQPPAVHIVLHTKAPAAKERKKPSLPEPSKEVPATKSDLTTTSNRPSKSKPKNIATQVETTTRTGALNLTPDTNTGSTITPTDSRVFHPRLQQQLYEAKIKGLRLTDERAEKLYVREDIHGTTVVDLGRGGCLKSPQRKTASVAQDWYMSGCNGKLSEGETMLSNMQKTLNAKNYRQ